MEPNLLIGDRLFVTKYSYGYSKHSFPFSPALFKGRLLFSEPERGDVVVFKTPADNRTDYIKRLIGIPGDQVQFIDSNLYLNKSEIIKSKLSKIKKVFCGKKSMDVFTFEEILPNKKKYISVYSKEFPFQNSNVFTVPENHYFFLGDNRDCSKDSRFLGTVGYVNKLNLVGEAKVIFFSNDTNKGRLLKFWNLKNSFRIERTFQGL